MTKAPVIVRYGNGPDPMIATDRLLDHGPWVLHDSTMGEAHEFCQRHGEDPHDVASIEYVPDGPLLRFSIYLADDNGNRYLDCTHVDSYRHNDTCHVARTTREHALIGDLPVWWQPTDDTASHNDTDDTED